MHAIVGTLALLAALISAPASAEDRSAAILGMVLLDTSTEGDYDGVRADQTRRIEMLEARLAEAFAERGWRIVDLTPAARDRIAGVVNIAQCNGCDSALASDLGADVAVTGEVQKVSNLILTINVFVREAATGKLIAVGNADIRSNTDESWLRGLNYVLKNRIFKTT